MPFVSDDRLRRLLEAEQMYEKMSAALSLIFQEGIDGGKPILPGFAKVGEWTFDAVVDLAREYKRLKDWSDNTKRFPDPVVQWFSERKSYADLPRTRPVPEPGPSDAAGGRTAD